MKPIGLALVAALAVAGCQPKPAPQVAALPVGLVDGVRGAVEQWRQAYEVRSMDALARLYRRDPSLFIVQDGALQLGWAAIEPALRGKLERATAIHVRIADLQVAALGSDAAVASAIMTRETRDSSDGATTVTENGIVTLALYKGDAGWVIASEHYSYKRP